MKFYITEETKQEIKAKIDELELVNKTEIENEWKVRAGVTYGVISILKEILSSATIISSVESWDDVYDMLVGINTFPIDYKNGVIINKK
jgi:hypothetical protein